MYKLQLYIGVLSAVIIGIFTLQTMSAFQHSIVVSSVGAHSTSTVIADVVLPRPALSTVATSSTDSPKVDKKSAPPKAAPKEEISTQVQNPVTSVQSFDPIALESAGTRLRTALVNILCYAPVGGRVHSISGSGVIVDPKGIILTNAHIAQYFLLADQSITCSIRSGSPAVSRYQGALIYIPESWVRANANVLVTQNPVGTGEGDYAFVAITKSSTSASLPPTFPFIPLAINAPNRNDPVVIASYGAQFLAGSQIQSSLYPTVVYGNVKDVFTFASSTIDVLDLGGTAAAQEGSSGGGVTGVDGTLLGTITTSTVDGDTSTRILDAITASYISRVYAKETNSSLDILFAKPIEILVSEFASNIAELEKIITKQLQ